MLKVAIQGVPGAFHEIAARQFFGSQIDVVPALSFPKLFELMALPDHADVAMLAIENSIAGSILGNYALLQRSDLCIVGEVYLRIQQNLLALPGTTLSNIREVHSHPIALAQCAEFFKAWPAIRLIESADTAESAANIARNQTPHIGAIASVLAAQLYGLQVLAPAIETHSENYTRFLALRRRSASWAAKDADKVSLCFTLANQPGQLAQVLGLLAEAGANLTKIQSVPLLGRPWEYQFYIDFKARSAQISALIDQLLPYTTQLNTLGVYKSAD